MAKNPNSSSCALCEDSNLACICTSCVNYKLSDHHTLLKSLNSVREPLYAKLDDLLKAKRRVEYQVKWRWIKNEKINKLKEELSSLKKRLSEEKAKVEEESNDLGLRYALLESSDAEIKKRHTEFEKFNDNLICTQGLAHVSITHELLCKQSVALKHICKFFPIRQVKVDGEKDGSSGSYDKICNARLPRGHEPHSVPSVELSASLGYMIQLLNLVVPTLAVPMLHCSGFAGSCSRIWQRNSYWDARPSSPSKEYPLFLPRQNFCSSGGESSWSERSSYNFGISSVESEKQSNLGDSRSGSYLYASQHSNESHNEFQKGLFLLKRSVGCITTYCSNSLCLDIPSEATPFDAFAKLLATLSSSRQMQSTRSLMKLTGSRSNKQGRQHERSVWNGNLAVSSSSSAESMHTAIVPAVSINDLSSFVGKFLRPANTTDIEKSESIEEEWDIVEYLDFPQPPSQPEDVKHRRRAKFKDAEEAQQGGCFS